MDDGDHTGWRSESPSVRGSARGGSTHRGGRGGAAAQGTGYAGTGADGSGYRGGLPGGMERRNNGRRGGYTGRGAAAAGGGRHGTGGPAGRRCTVCGKDGHAADRCWHNPDVASRATRPSAAPRPARASAPVPGVPVPGPGIGHRTEAQPRSYNWRDDHEPVEKMASVLPNAAARAIEVAVADPVSKEALGKLRAVYASLLAGRNSCGDAASPPAAAGSSAPSPSKWLPRSTEVADAPPPPFNPAWAAVLVDELLPTAPLTAVSAFILELAADGLESAAALRRHGAAAGAVAVSVRDPGVDGPHVSQAWRWILDVVRAVIVVYQDNESSSALLEEKRPRLVSSSAGGGGRAPAAGAGAAASALGSGGAEGPVELHWPEDAPRPTLEAETNFCWMLYRLGLVPRLRKDQRAFVKMSTALNRRTFRYTAAGLGLLCGLSRKQGVIYYTKLVPFVQMVDCTAEEKAEVERGAAEAGAASEDVLQRLVLIPMGIAFKTQKQQQDEARVSGVQLRATPDALITDSRGLIINGLRVAWIEVKDPFMPGAELLSDHKLHRFNRPWSEAERAVQRTAKYRRLLGKGAVLCRGGYGQCFADAVRAELRAQRDHMLHPDSVEAAEMRAAGLSPEDITEDDVVLLDGNWFDRAIVLDGR